MNNAVFIIPVYNHSSTMRVLLEQLSAYNKKAIIVNDGSNDKCTHALREIAGKYGWVSLLERTKNKGKGAAVKLGLREAARRGFTHAIQLDADGQHDINDVRRLLSLAQKNPDAVISGTPVYHNAPAIRRYGRYLTHIWVWINTLSFDIEDSMCGFRAYPVTKTIQILDHSVTGNRMEFDSEILVRLHWAGVRVIQFHTTVCYPAGGISHFRMLRDNLLISWTHARLFFGMCVRLPTIILKKWRQHD